MTGCRLHNKGVGWHDGSRPGNTDGRNTTPVCHGLERCDDVDDDDDDDE